MFASIGSNAMMCSRLFRTTRPIATLFMSRIARESRCECGMSNFAIGTQFIRADEI